MEWKSWKGRAGIGTQQAGGMAPWSCVPMRHLVWLFKHPLVSVSSNFQDESCIVHLVEDAALSRWKESHSKMKGKKRSSRSTPLLQLHLSPSSNSGPIVSDMSQSSFLCLRWNGTWEAHSCDRKKQRLLLRWTWSISWKKTKIVMGDTQHHLSQRPPKTIANEVLTAARVQATSVPLPTPALNPALERSDWFP